MKHFIPGPDNKPCIWPIPASCIWNGERYLIKNGIKLDAPDAFKEEARIFIRLLGKAGFKDAEPGAGKGDVRLEICEDQSLEEEGYFLDVTEKGALIRAAKGTGALNGCMSLLQLIVNSPDPSMHGVHISDRPERKRRCVSVNAPSKEDMPRFESFLDLCAVYKLNAVYLKTPMGKEELTAIKSSVESRHMAILTPEECSESEIPCKIPGEAGSFELALKKNIYRIIKAACLYWSERSLRDEGLDGTLLPEWMERLAARIYPAVRDGVFGAAPPSKACRSFKTLNIRHFYNAPLYRLCWNKDDYDYRFMEEAKYIPNAVPFSILQGVMDYKRDNAFVLAGNGWNEGIYGIGVGQKLKSLCFLHSYILDKKYVRRGKESTGCSEPAVGCYRIHYSGGGYAEGKLFYENNISHWNANLRDHCTAYEANPAYVGMTDFHTPYVMYSYEWINERPETEIEKIDIIPSENRKDGGIAVFAITGTGAEEERRK